MIYIVEDDLSFGKSIERLLRASGYKTVLLGSAHALLEIACFKRPACLLLDVRLPGIDGLNLQQKLLEKGIALPIIFMTGHGTIPMSVQAMKKGAVDFLPKPFTAAALTDAINRALARDKQHTKEDSLKHRVLSLISTLTPREKELLSWVISGKLNKQIARSLGIAEMTVKVHRGRIMQKLRISSIADLVRLTQIAGIRPATKA